MIARFKLACAFLATAAVATGPLYDYVIVGGGTSGLVVANRLSEDPNVSVVVIEAGYSVHDNDNVTAANGYGKAFGTEIDYQYESVNQTYAGNSKQTLRAGKALGGTSTINGMSYTRAEDVQIDAWKELGNRGWSWNSLFPYYQKSEQLTRPSPDEIAAGASYNESAHGYDGPLHVGFNNMQEGNLTTPLNQTYDKLGIPWVEDVNDGRMRGFNVFPETINHELGIREDAARAYYWPYRSRPNLIVMTKTRANKILWSDDNATGGVSASGVEIQSGNITSVVKARKEVILSTGSIRTPALLELSGVGNKDILEKHNITVRVDLPTVGENLQDQTNANTMALGNGNWTGVKALAYASFYDIFGDDAQAVAGSVLHKLADYAAQTSEATGGVVKQEDLANFFQIQYDLLFSNAVPMVEILFIPTHSPMLITEYWTLLPFSRGNVHINSADPAENPVINPNYFMVDWDLQAHIGVTKFIRNMYQTAPLSDMIKMERAPGPDVPQNATDTDWEEYTKKNYRSNFHPVGTAAMMPRSMGGVVSDRLTVHGTSNVRIVDASVLPFQMCGHLTSTLYAIAERASDLIKEDA
ncbi:hypothetical protein SI65_00040 [Aspergillus cristatus]|uniref:glucose oxidase n=1 Tax=Aspergillus cristatus TaxID=573508 RepID=A0A1E3BNA3_ASPCR|nr:hypothetical protein SI65_00040 [Aspergillus cristatus]